MANEEEPVVLDEVDETQAVAAVDADASEAEALPPAVEDMEPEDDTPKGVPEISDSNVFGVLVLGSAFFYLMALVMAMIALRDYCHPERFLRFW